MTTFKSSPIKWLVFFLIWACVTSGSYAAAFYLTLETDYGDILTLGLAVLIAGVLTGVFQGFLLRLIKRSGMVWFVSSVIGHILAPFTMLFPALLVWGIVSQFNFNDPSEWLMSVVFGTTIGAIVGVGQWLSLRRHTTKGWIWIIATMLLWALLLSDLNSAGLKDCWGGPSPSQFWVCMPVVRVSVDFILMGIASGGVLVLLLGCFPSISPSLSTPAPNNPLEKSGSSKKVLLVIVLLTATAVVCVIGFCMVLGIVPI